jgi:ribosomal protein S18 acetylase RimI-like enzyme
LAERGGKKMMDYPRGTESTIESNTSPVLRRNAEILQDSVRKAVRTSPDSFLKTVGDVDAKGPDYWMAEIETSTWAVVERNGEVVGVAAAKRPDPDHDDDDPETSRYIESVWIAPDLRGHRLGKRLIKYLLEAEYQKSRRIKQVLLWVLTTNSAAIKLYLHMGFVRTLRKNEGIKTEIEYRLDFNRKVYAAIGLAVARWYDRRRYGVTYRVLEKGDSA